eukprot:TRINITY_DN399_c0_g1_i3.p1 TRINITY_DN399_c0_g1~~TRINITY_DN399_c0_g1_i3.p1  ORF type:complete len:158 (+),score=30.98 TRINITY_DN399_c0_g1_i3:146-619(+)
MAGKKAVIAIDGSAHSLNAWDYAIKNILKEQDFVVLLNIRRNPKFLVTDSVLSASHDTQLFETEKKLKEKSDALLQDYKEKTIAVGLKNVEVKAKEGDARMEIVKVVEEEKADLLIVGSRGLGPGKRMLLGSVSDYCAHHSSCPVLIYRPLHAANGH